MRLKKSGFSLAEVLVMLTVIGIAVIIELIIVQGKMNQYGAPYYAAYNALKKANYNILADIYCPDSHLPEKEQKCRVCSDINDPNTCVNGARPFPTNSEDMCNRLIEFINVSDTNSIKCENTLEDTDSQTGTTTIINTDINKFANNINDKTVRFISSNAMKFYLSDMQQRDINGEIINYFIVYVDLNGTKKPNRIDKEQDNPIYPDIVPFALTTRGEVIPIGYPIYSNIYLTAKIKFPDKHENNQYETNQYSGSMSYYEAVYGAWGNANNNDHQETADIPQSIDFNKNLENGNEEDNAAIAFFNKNELENQLRQGKFRNDKNCTAGTYTCRVVIDSSTGARI